MALDRGQVPTAIGLKGSLVSCAAGLLVMLSHVYVPGLFGRGLARLNARVHVHHHFEETTIHSIDVHITDSYNTSGWELRVH